MKITSYIVSEPNTTDLIRGIIEFTEDKKIYHKCYVDMYGNVRGFGSVDDVDSKYIEKELLPNLYEYDNKILEQGRTPSLADNKQYKPFKEYELKDGDNKWNLSTIISAIMDVRSKVVTTNKNKYTEMYYDQIHKVQEKLEALEAEKDKKLSEFANLRQFSKPHRYVYTKQFSKKSSRFDSIKKKYKNVWDKVTDLEKKYPEIEDDLISDEVFDKFYAELTDLIPDDKDRAYILYMFFGMSI